MPLRMVLWEVSQGADLSNTSEIDILRLSLSSTILSSVNNVFPLFLKTVFLKKILCGRQLRRKG